MKKAISILMFFVGVLAYHIADAQVIIGGRYGRRPVQRRVQAPRQQQPEFKPGVTLSVGYGFPNADKEQLPVFYNYYPGAAIQNGPLTGALDYRFNRRMSIGVMVTHGKVTVPYYDYNTNVLALTGSLESWSVMLNMVRYMPVYNSKLTPYVRTAIGINSWQQNFTDASGSKINLGFNPGDLAYQVGVGANFALSKNTGLFVEAGYGKYILQGGIAIKL
jgi:predicted porin